jgi:hypothetical protein
MRSVIVLVPVYQARLSPLEQYSLDTSVAALQGRPMAFIGPAGLDMAFYQARYPGIPFIAFEPASFASIQGYNRLLLDPAFYEGFADYEFMLILQTDAVVLRDELALWCGQPFDYVGAPWPDGIELFVNLGVFEGERGRRVRAMVGNGGLSLRRNAKHAALLREFPEARQYFTASGSSEDLFFSLMGGLSRDFVLPNEITASRFAMELKPRYYHEVNGGHLPMGGHAWWKYDMAFWRAALPPSPVLDQLVHP